MFCLELSVLLHRALETRVETLMNELARPGWQDLPDALHDVRVASRRVRTVLSLVQPGLYPGHKRQTRNLKRLTRALGRTREMDVHAAILENLARRAPDLAAAPAREHLLEVLARRLGKARRSMARALERINLKRLPHLLQVPSLPDPFRHEEDLGPAIWDSLAPWLEGAFPGNLSWTGTTPGRSMPCASRSSACATPWKCWAPGSRSRPRENSSTCGTSRWPWGTTMTWPPCRRG